MRAATIRSRLILLAVVTTTVLLGLGLGTVWFARQLSGDWAALQSVAQRQSLLSDMKSALGYGGAIHDFKNYVLRQESRYIDGGNEAFSEFQTAVQVYRSLPELAEQELAELATIEGTIRQYVAALTTARGLFAEGLTVAEVDQTVRIDDGPALQAFDSLDERMRVLAAAENEALNRDVRSFVVFFTIVGGSGLVLVLLLSIVTNRFITKRLARILGVTGTVAQGDLSRLVGMAGKDEIGTLAADFDRAIENLRSLIGQVKLSSGETFHFSDVLRSKTTSFSNAVGEINSNIQTIDSQFTTLDSSLASSSTATEQILANISSLVRRIDAQANTVRTTSAAVEEMASSIDSVSKIAVTKQAAADQLVGFTDEGGEKLTTANQYIQEISQSVDGILGMISVINDVAAQTNLLSMNAAIEAAHAGEAGKGFAVVADEIRKLAVSTAENASIISSTLSTMVGAIEQAQGASVASRDAFDRIRVGVRDVAEAFAEISASSEELAIGSKEILRSATELVDITDEINAGAGEMESGARDISTELLKVKGISGDTLRGLREIGSSSNEIAGSLDEISLVSKTNEEHAKILQDNVEKFHLNGSSPLQPDVQTATTLAEV